MEKKVEQHSMFDAEPLPTLPVRSSRHHAEPEPPKPVRSRRYRGKRNADGRRWDLQTSADSRNWITSVVILDKSDAVRALTELQKHGCVIEDTSDLALRKLSS